MIRLLEEISNNALPAPYTLQYDGWIIRLADATMRRANSVSPLYPSTLPLSEKIAYVESLYAARGRPTVFKMTNAAHPTDLAQTLLDRGYQQTVSTSVQTLDLAAYTPRLIPAHVITPRIDALWDRDHTAFSPPDERPRLTPPAMYDAIIPQTGFIRILHGDADAPAKAVGMGVIEHGWLGIYGVAVDPSLRNQGIGMALMDALLAWGINNGARHAYLQVMTVNAPAMRLYQKIGFTEAYQYWYIQK